jgi:uncharacterized protein YdbL (DUF1318 family)
MEEETKDSEVPEVVEGIDIAEEQGDVTAEVVPTANKAPARKATTKKVATKKAAAKKVATKKVAAKKVVSRRQPPSALQVYVGRVIASYFGSSVDTSALVELALGGLSAREQVIIQAGDGNERFALVVHKDKFLPQQPGSDVPALLHLSRAVYDAKMYN